jgi:AraC-like DNA-binding protein
MTRDYDFSEIAYEYVTHDPALPFKAFLISIGYRGLHWHREIEIIHVLEGELTLSRPGSRTKLREGESKEKRRRDIERARKLLDYMARNSQNPLRLKEVSGVVGLSPYYVSHIIREITGLSFQQNLNVIRTHHAIHSIITTDERLIDIALEAGFSDIKYMNKCVRELYGASPSELRSVTDRVERFSRSPEAAGMPGADVLKMLRRR